jgi:hypothetical protein
MLLLTERLVATFSGGAGPNLSVCALLVPNLLEALKGMATDPPLNALRAVLLGQGES